MSVLSWLCERFSHILTPNVPSINSGFIFYRRELVRAGLNLLLQVTSRFPKGTAKSMTMN